MVSEVIISNEASYTKKKNQIVDGGFEELHVVADFDRTLTKAFVNGEKTPSVISELRRKHYISEHYSKKATELAEFYHPIEIDPE